MEENLEFHIKVSYFEIYMDKIRDLLDGKSWSFDLFISHNFRKINTSLKINLQFLFQYLKLT